MKFLAIRIRRSAERHALLHAGQEPLARRQSSLLGRMSRWLGLAPLLGREEGHQHRDVLSHPSGALRELDFAIAVYARKCQQARQVVNLLPAAYVIPHRLEK